MDGIAICKMESSEGDYVKVGFMINDPNPKDKIGDAISRVELSNENKTAALFLKDANGNTRIRMMVNAEGQPKIEVLSEKGEVVKDLMN